MGCGSPGRAHRGASVSEPGLRGQGPGGRWDPGPSPLCGRGGPAQPGGPVGPVWGLGWRRPWRPGRGHRAERRFLGLPPRPQQPGTGEGLQPLLGREPVPACPPGVPGTGTASRRCCLNPGLSSGSPQVLGTFPAKANTRVSLQDTSSTRTGQGVRGTLCSARATSLGLEPEAPECQDGETEARRGKDLVKVPKGAWGGSRGRRRAHGHRYMCVPAHTQALCGPAPTPAPAHPDRSAHAQLPSLGTPTPWRSHAGDHATHVSVHTCSVQARGPGRGRHLGLESLEDMTPQSF